MAHRVAVSAGDGAGPAVVAKAGRAVGALELDRGFDAILLAGVDQLGEPQAGVRLMRALESVCKDGPRIRSSASTSEVGEAVAARASA